MPKRAVAGGSPVSGGTRTIVTVIATLAVLYVGRDILMPLALAGLLSFALGRPVDLLERLGCGRTLAAGLVASVMVAFLTGASWIAVSQMQEILEELPNHRTSIKNKLGNLTHHFAAMEAFGKVFAPAAPVVAPATVHEPTATPVAAGTSPNHPLYTATVDGGATVLRQVPGALSALMSPLGSAGMVVLLAVFMLLHREDLRHRLLRLFGNGDVTGTTQAMTEAGQRIGRLLGVQALINGTSGIVVALGLYLIGVPGWALWGLLYGLLRILPYIGPLLGVAMPVAMALAVSPGWGLFLAAATFLLVVEVLIDFVFEPWLFGERSGISSFAVLVAAAFWSWLWGPIGLLLAMPLTVVVVVLGKSMPQFRFLHVLFGAEQLPSPAERYYQCVMANDPDEAIRILEDAAVDEPVARGYEAILVPALLATERDWTAGKLTEQEYTAVCDILRDSLEAMELRAPAADGAANERVVHSGAVPEKAPKPRRGEFGVVCVAMKPGATEVAAALACQVVQRAGHRCRTLDADWSSADWAECVDDDEIVCIVSLPDPTLRRARALCSRVHGRRASVSVVVMAWGTAIDPDDWRYRSLAGGVVAMATSAGELLAAVGRVREGMSGTASTGVGDLTASGKAPAAT